MSPELAVMEDSSRAERRLQALLALDHDQEGLRNMDWGSRGPQSTGDAVLGIERLSVLDEEPLNVSHGPKAVANGVSGHASISPKGSVSHDGDFWNGADNPVLMPKAPSIHPQVSSLYSRASSLLLDAMDADGVLFLSAPRDTTRQNSRRSSCISLGEMDGTPKTAGVRRRSSSLSSAAEWDEKLCHQLSSASTVACRSSTKSSCALTQGSLHGLIDLFPHGEIFNSVQAANASNMSQIESASTMRQSFPDAQSLLFLPVWDWDKSKWASVAIIWAHQNQFRECDLRYLRTFSQAIVSKLVQVGRKTVQKAKDDLLASLSHELRSPLHGMLANSELLRSTSLDSTQRDMVKMIQTCGSTLLDTMNHLLNFAKINNLSNANNVSIDNAAQIEGMMTHFDLDDIIEDLTECLYAGYRSPSELSDMSCRPEKNGGDLGNAKHVKITQDLAVVIRIENRRSWRICGIPGAWRRIIMNIVGNALKFTRTGLIEITLDWASRSQRNSKSSDVRITVTDTGCGISPEYLQEKLFIPFSQEHILTEGVGLGLSISRQLLAKLGGIIDIKSEVDVGTQVDIQIPVEFLEQEQTADGLDSRNGEMKVPKRVCLVGYESNTEDEGSIKAKRKLAIRDAVRSAVQHQKGFKVSTAQSLSDGPGDIAVIEESTLHELASNGPVQSVFSSVVVLGAHASALRGSGFNGSINVVNVPQPYVHPIPT
ncbi:sensor histidine kinase [Aspergillus undulatus]|uniref:sensor histidine kinase n=1 Tax=Aspergillus undulatus TaxID=1810928 RepID=UPI003CCDFCD0